MIFTVDVDLAEDGHLGMGFPAAARSYVFESVEQFLVQAGFLQVELVAGEGEDGESVGAVAVDQAVEVQVLFGVN